MIRITIELVPFGFIKPKTIASAEIWNDGAGDENKGNYGYSLNLEHEKGWRKGEVKNHSRNKNIWWLLGRVLEDMNGNNKSEDRQSENDW